jgi:hypothetical protein
VLSILPGVCSSRPPLPRREGDLEAALLIGRHRFWSAT